MDIYDNLPSNDIHILTSDDATYSAIFLYKPSRIGEFPTIDESDVDSKWITIATKEYMNEYFQQFYLDEDAPTLSIGNGLHQDINEYYSCDICRKVLEPKMDENIEDEIMRSEYSLYLPHVRYWCFHCSKDMCYDCRDKHILEHNDGMNRIITPARVIDSTLCQVCDRCNDELDAMDYHYISEGKANVDVCMSCYEKEDFDGKTDLILYNPKEPKYHMFYHTGLKSMLYWVPLVYDTGDNHVLMNLNPDDEYFGRLCLQCNDGDDSYVSSGRDWEVRMLGKHVTLQMVLKSLKKITEKGTFVSTTYKDRGNTVIKVEKVFGEGTEHEIQYPIQLLMKKDMDEKDEGHIYWMNE